MSTVTLFVVVSFVRCSDGELVSEQPIEFRSAALAQETASRMALVKAGTVAFCRTCRDEGAGRGAGWAKTTILSRFGEVPDDIDEAFFLGS